MSAKYSKCTTVVQYSVGYIDKSQYGVKRSLSSYRQIKGKFCSFFCRGKKEASPQKSCCCLSLSLFFFSLMIRFFVPFPFCVRWSQRKSALAVSMLLPKSHKRYLDLARPSYRTWEPFFPQIWHFFFPNNLVFPLVSLGWVVFLRGKFNMSFSFCWWGSLAINQGASKRKWAQRGPGGLSEEGWNIRRKMVMEKEEEEEEGPYIFS